MTLSTLRSQDKLSEPIGIANRIAHKTRSTL